jgi:hypothetical protein
MISDILSQMVDDFDHYLNDPTYDHTDYGTMWELIIRLRDDAEYIRVILDTHIQTGVCREGSFVSRSLEMGTKIASPSPPLPISPTQTPAAR